MNPIQIKIKQDMPGFEDFFSSRVLLGNINMVVDLGPKRSVHRLIQSLQSMSIERLDYVLLTHIHIDHAGGLFDILEQFPMVKAICHEKGIKHLVDPSRLWQGSLQTLGRLAEDYGVVKPVKKEQLIAHVDADIPGLRIIETPGHAAHHLSYIYEGTLFAGEAGGNYFKVGELEYLRPATPPRFFLEEFLTSIKRLLDLGNQRICYAHVEENPDSSIMLKRFYNQLLCWREIIEKELIKSSDNLEARCVEGVLQKDPELGGFVAMQPDTQARERMFIGNSVRGYLDFFHEIRGNPA